MRSKIEKGHIEPFWGSDHRNLPYERQPVSEEEVNEWVEEGYDYVKNFTGSMYSSKNPLPSWISALKESFDLYKQTYTFYRMDTLEIMPTHIDHYNTYMKLTNTRYNNVYRVVLMLEDWQPGHYFELDGIGYVNWKAGDWFKWKSDTPHAASNIGKEPRYTLQITGAGVLEGQLNDLFCFNVSELLDCDRENVNPIIEHNIIPLIEDNNKPFMLYMDNGYIKQLDQMIHDDDTIQKLNKEGLRIYLYEPMCAYKVDSEHKKIPHNQVFYSEFNGAEDKKELRVEELDSIHMYAKRNSLNNITVYTGDYNIQLHYTHYDSLKLLTNDLCLKTTTPIQKVNKSKLRQINISKKFLCLNWRYTKHRNLLAAFLAQKSAHLSWYFDTPYDILRQNLFFDLERWKISHLNHFNTINSGLEVLNNTSWCLDIKSIEKVKISDPYHYDIWPKALDLEQTTTPALYNSSHNSLQQYYNDIFVDIVNETRFAQPTANFSEKTLQSIQYMRPFILVAPPFTLEYLRSEGFKTFSDFWDESYDSITDHGERLAKIFDLIDEIEKMPINRLCDMYSNMTDILDHNIKVFLDKFASVTFKKSLPLP